MVPPPFDVDSGRHTYTGGHFRRRLKNIVGAYVEGKINTGATTPGITEPPAPARLLQDRLAEEERINKVDAKDTAAVAGEEKLVLFPTYARAKPHLFHASHHHKSTSEHGTRRVISLLIIVDVDLHVHGQVSIPHQPNAPLRRKDRILLSVARQICGLPPLPTSGPTNAGVMKKRSIDIIRRMSGRSSTPTQSPSIEKSNPMDDTSSMLSGEFVDEPDLIDMNTPSGGRSPQSVLSRTSSKVELPSLSRTSSFNDSPTHSATFPLNGARFPSPTRANTVPSRPPSAGGSSPPKSSSSAWKNSHNFPALDLATCHANLMERLAPFIARSVSGRLVTIKVYCPSTSADFPDYDLESRPIIAQRQFLTNEYGHFSGKLIVSPPRNSTPPDTWTITASLSGTEPKTVQSEVKFIPEHGISLISDIDDTVKHTSILSGARELFRNTFVRDLSSMSIDGVREWYTSLTQMGVQIHYVSNSPYQCWPIIASFMNAVGLPRGGSIQLKQYSGMISGIWENAADKKRAGVEGILRDFPGRKFVLVGDSGEQDLELYTELALNYRDQVLGIFIRDVTTPLLNRSGSSAVSLPMYFDNNGFQQPQKREGRLAQLRGMQWRRSQESVSTLASLHEGVPISNIPVANIPKTNIEENSSSDEFKDFEQLSVRDMEELGPLLFKAEEAGEGIQEDLPLRRSKTPPALPPRHGPHRTQSMTSISSDPADIKSFPPPPKTLSVESFRGQTPERTGTTLGQEDQGTRVKRVENWKRRIARCREQLFNADTGVEIWTWRNGGDVESICESLVTKAMDEKKSGGKRAEFEAIRDTVKEHLGTQL